MAEQLISWRWKLLWGLFKLWWDGELQKRLSVSSKGLLLVSPLCRLGPGSSVTLTAVVSKYPDRCNVKNKSGS